MLARATIQPKLVDDPNYNGFHLTKSDADRIVKQLPGKPIHVEHNDKHVVGKVVTAFESDGGIDIVFETNDETFKDTLSNEMLSSGMLKDVSMTVSAMKGYSDGVPTILSKNITEVSLVERGAIPGSHISWSAPRIRPSNRPLDSVIESKEYIGKSFSNNQKQDKTMSTESSTTDNSPKVLADQLREMSAQLERERLEREAEREQLRKDNEKLAQKNAELSAEQTAERVKMVEGDVAVLFNRVMEQFEKKSKDKDKYRASMEAWMRNMKEKDSNQTLTEVFAQASQLVEENFNKAETAFQQQREAAELAKKERAEAELKAAEWQKKELDYKKKVDELVQTINSIRSGSFTSVNDRFVEKLPTVGSSSSSSVDEPVISASVPVLARASAYFDAGYNPLDEIISEDMPPDVKRIRPNEFVTPDNADIFAKLNDYRDVA